MYWIPRATAVVTLIAVVFHCSLPTLAETGATIEGTVEIPCEPSLVRDVASVQIRSLSGGSSAIVAVDSSTGKFLSPGLTEGEYELIAIGADGNFLSPEAKRLLIRNGSNTVVLSLRPPGCGEQDSDRGKKKPGRKAGLEDWQLTLIYFGVVGAIVIALDDDDEAPASPFVP